MKRIFISTICLALLAACSVALESDSQEVNQKEVSKPDTKKVEKQEEVVLNKAEVEEIPEEKLKEAETVVLPKEEKEVVEKAKEEPKVSNEDTIRSFYQYIEDHEFQKAYDLYKVKKIGFETFRGWYKDVTEARVSELEKKDDTTYTFRIYLTESNGTTGTFDVTMVAEDGKLETKSSEHIQAEEETCHGKTCASIYRNLDRYCIMVNLPDAKAPKMLSCTTPGASFTNLRFSPRGQYILHDEEFDSSQGWHIINTYVYDMGTFARVNSLLENVTFIDVVLDDTRLVACGVPGDSDTGYVRIFSLPSGEMLKWEVLQEKNPGCKYDPTSQSVVWSDYEGQRKTLDVHSGDSVQ